MLFSIKMNELDSLPNHLLKIKDIRDQLNSIDRTIEEEYMVVITLRSFPSSYANFIETLNITSTDKDLTFEQLSTKLLKGRQKEKTSWEEQC
jgi:hypothetical protein